MTAFKIIAMPMEEARHFQRGGLDANNSLKPEVHTAHGPSNPCRHCQKPIEEGADMLVLAYRPFDKLQPYAELGPVFLHSRECERHAPDAGLPEMFSRWDAVIVRGYSKNHRIHYMAAEVVLVAKLEERCKALLEDTTVKYLHIRTARYNCYQCRVERAA